MCSIYYWYIQLSVSELRANPINIHELTLIKMLLMFNIIIFMYLYMVCCNYFSIRVIILTLIKKPRHAPVVVTNVCYFCNCLRLILISFKKISSVYNCKFIKFI